MLGTCYRCGMEFHTVGKNRLCSACLKPRDSGDQPLNRNLTFREWQVVRLVTQARLNKEIAFELHLSEGTIKEYLNTIYRKLGTRNRTELAVWAATHQHGLVSS